MFGGVALTNTAVGLGGSSGVGLGSKIIARVALGMAVACAASLVTEDKADRPPIGLVGVLVSVAKTSVEARTGAKVGTTVGVADGVGATVGVSVTVGVHVGVAVGNGVLVGVFVGVAVGVGVGPMAIT